MTQVATQAAAASEPGQPVRQGDAEHYLWGGANDGWHYLKRDDISIIRERMVPGGREERHLHRQARQFFYVLTGTLTMHLPDGDWRIAAGEGLEIAPGTPHQAINASDAPIEFLVTSMPPSHGDRVAVPE